MGGIGRITLILLLAIFALWAVDYVSLLFSPCSEPPIENPANHGISGADQRYRCPKSQGIVSAGISLIGQELARIADWTPEAWIAACTAVLALATLGLAIVTRRQVQLAREEFIATNRPLLRVRRFQRGQAPAGGDERITVNFAIVNVGNSDAILIESHGGIEFVPPDEVVPMRVYDGLPRVIEPRVFAPGTSAEGFILDRPDRQQGPALRVYGLL